MNDMGGFPAPTFDGETQLWAAKIINYGGKVPERSKYIADALIRAIKASSFNAKVLYLLPLLGPTLLEARVPLRGGTIALNSGFADSNFVENAGLSNTTEAAIFLDTGVYPSQLGSGNNGGLGWWETNWGAGSGVEPMGCYSNEATNKRYVLDGRSNVQAFRWGAAGNSAGDTNTFSNAHYYGQRVSATLRQLFKNGRSQGTDNTTNDATIVSNTTIRLMGSNAFSGTTAAPTYWKGRCSLAYLTDGSMTAQEVLDFHVLLTNLLIGPLGRA